MALSVVKSAQSASASATFTGGNTGGNLIVVGVVRTGAAISTPTDTIGNIYVDCGAGAAVYQEGNNFLQLFMKPDCANTASDNIVTSTGASEVIIYEINGAALSSPLDGSSINSNASSGAGANNLTCSAISTSNKDLVICLFGSISGNAMTAGTAIAWTAPTTGTALAMMEYFIQSAAGSISGTGNQSAGNGISYGAILAAFKPRTILEQSAYRFRADDGDETTATWAENENTQLTASAGTNIRPRIQLNATADPVSKTFQIEYKNQVSSSGDWHKVGE